MKRAATTTKAQAARLCSRCCLERMTRTWAIIKHAKEPVTATTLALEFECTTKTIYRDIEFLRDRIGLPIATSYGFGCGGYYVANKTAKLPWWIC